MSISLIVAMSENRVIGKGNQLPWHIPEDLKRFKQLTLGHPVILGRKTHESIGRVLPQRENIIVSRQIGYLVPGAKVAHSLEDAFSLARASAGSEEIFVIGGAEIYRLAMKYAQRIYLTLVHEVVEGGDATFPEISPSEFKEVARDKRDATPGFSYLLYERL